MPVPPDSERDARGAQPAATARVRSDFDRIAALPDDPCNHNLLYHRVLLAELPARCGAALEIGCGTGAFTQRLAARAERVVAIDLAPRMVEAARARCAGLANVALHVADATAWQIGAARWDAIASIATLHHLPAAETLARLRDGLRPGGVLLVLDLVADDGPWDRLRSAAALPANAALRLARTGRLRMPPAARRLWEEHGRHDVYPSLAAVRALAGDLLPGARVRRHLFWRYSLVWRKPGGAGATLGAPRAEEP
jgi:SAM-dependent methyltransferase